MEGKAYRTFCVYCERSFDAPRRYERGDVFDCPLCGHRQVSNGAAMNRWFLYGMKPVRFGLWAAGVALFGAYILLLYLVVFALQAWIGFNVGRAEACGLMALNDIVHFRKPKWRW